MFLQMTSFSAGNRLFPALAGVLERILMMFLLETWLGTVLLRHPSDTPPSGVSGGLQNICSLTHLSSCISVAQLFRLFVCLSVCPRGVQSNRGGGDVSARLGLTWS